MDGPMVSVVITTYYRNEMLAEAVESVLDQPYGPIEIIVVDGSGEDHAKPVIDDYDDVAYVGMAQNRGPNKARDIGIERTSGEYIQLLDDDDQVIDDKFTKQLAVFEENPDVGVVYGGIEISSGDVYLPREEGRGDVLELALMDELAYCMTATMLFDADVLHEIIPLPDTPGMDDAHWKVQLARQTKFDFVDDPVALYRTEGQDSMRSDSWAELEAMDLMLEWYSDLYDRYPPYVRKNFKTKRYAREADYLLDERGWSLRAIWLFLLAFYHTPVIGRLGVAVGALFGRPGVELIRYL